MSREEMRKKEKLALRLLRKNMRAADVARDERIDVHPTTVQRWAKKAGIELTYPYNRHESRDDLVDKKEILRLRKRAMIVDGKRKPLFTLEEIAGLCNCSRSYVKRVCAQARKEGKL